MKSIMIGLVVFCFASIASAQPWRDGQGPPRERKMDVKDFGDVDRLERAGPPHQMGQNRGEFRPQKQFRPQPNFGMNGWGGDPFKQFGSGRPWGGPGGPPESFRGRGQDQEVRGYSLHNGGRGRQYHGGREDFKRSPEKSKCDGNCPFCKRCPFCGTKIG